MVNENLISKEFEVVSKKYNKLFPPEKLDNNWVICGDYEVIDPKGYCWETYGIKILIPDMFPYELPKLIETSDKIKHHEDWHNTNGACCLSPDATIYREIGLPISLIKWLDTFVHDFLANHVIKIRENNYAKGEFSHGTKGIIEGYFEVFGTNDTKIINQKLKLLCSSIQLGRNTPCFCGSNIKFKNCYLKTPYTHTILGIPVSVIEKDYREISSYLLTSNSL